MTRQINVATTSSLSCMWNAIHHSSPQNTAPSLMRSQVASSTAPNRVPPPRSRAMAPSSMSNTTKNQTTQAPANSLPIGNSVSAPATDAMVPTMVTPSGVRPIRSAALAVGSVSRANAARDRNGILLIAHVFRPRGRQQLASVAQQLRNHLGAADDGDEVRVPAPARHHVHVQVFGQ